VEAYKEHFREFEILPLGPEVYTLAAELRAHHRLRTPDALHAAAAIRHGCEEIWTGDRRLAAIEDRIRLRVFEETT